MFLRFLHACVGAGVLVPLLFLLWSWHAPETEILQHLSETILVESLWGSVKIVLLTSLFAGVIGYGFALFQLRYRYFGAGVMDWLLVLPLAFPPYIYGLAFQGVFGEDKLLGFEWSVGFSSAVFCLGIVMYPYVYLMSRVGIGKVSKSLYQSAQLTGSASFDQWKRITLPLSLPWLSAGVLMVAMEALADFGVVSLFSVSAITTLVYKTWFDLYSLQGAAQIAALGLFPAFFLIVLDRWNRKKVEHYSHSKSLRVEAIRLQGYQSLLPFFFIVVFLLLALGLPVFQLILWALKTDLAKNLSPLFEPMFQTLRMCLYAVIAGLLAGGIVVFARRFYRYHWVRLLSVVSTSGYAIPGTLLAVGFYLPLMDFEGKLLDFFESWGWEWDTFLYSHTSFLIVAGLLVRFLSVPLNSLDAGLKNIPKNLDQSALLLGENRWGVMRKIHFPLLSKSILTASLLLALEVAKELPMTLMLRPMGFDPLSVKIFQYAVEGDWERASIPALVLLMLSGLGVFLLWNRQSRLEKNEP